MVASRALRAAGLRVAVLEDQGVAGPERVVTKRLNGRRHAREVSPRHDPFDLRELLAGGRGAGPFGHHGRGRLGEAVDERGLARVRVADDGDLHRASRSAGRFDQRDDAGDDLADVERLCERLLIIDHGTLIEDSTVAGITDRYGTERTLIVDLVEPAPALEIDGARASYSNHAGLVAVLELRPREAEVAAFRPGDAGPRIFDEAAAMLAEGEDLARARQDGGRAAAGIGLGFAAAATLGRVPLRASRRRLLRACLPGAAVTALAMFGDRTERDRAASTS